MRKCKAVAWGLISAGLGLLSIWPSFPVYPRRGLAWAQLIATENPGLGMVSGALAVLRSVQARSRRGLLLGVIGLGLGLRPLIRRERVNRAMSDAMRAGLGLGWQRQIPAEAHRRFGQSHRTDLWGPLLYLLRARVRITRDVLFAMPEGRPLRLDIYEPRASAEGQARPAVIVVHGGAGFQGDKSAYAFGLHDRWLAGQGYVVFDVQYRLGARWPAPLDDVRAAIRWVKANAKAYGVDPARVAIMGRAAGGHLALLAAYTAAPDDGMCAVVASYAPADLRMWPAERGSAIAELMGGLPEDVPEAYREAAPVTHVRPGLPPTLLIHGQRDRTIPPVHSELLANALRAAGVTVVTLRIPWGRHGVDSLIVGLTGPMIQYDVDRFLAWVFAR